VETPAPLGCPRPGVPAATAWVGLVCLAAVGLGVFARLWLLSNSPVNSDEAVVGLMAKQALHGHLHTFYWGQDYGGVEPLGLAVLFGVFGTHAWLIRACPGLIEAAACVVLWRLGRRMFGTGVGGVAAALAWVWPESDVRNSVQAFGFRGAQLVCGLLVLLAALRISTGEDRRSTWALLGAAAGVGWWASPEILYFAVPAAPFVAWSAWRRGGRAVAADGGVLLGALVAGMLPWLYTNAHTHFASLRVGSHYGAADGTYLHRLGILFSKTLPIILGTRAMQRGTWLGGAAGPVLYGVLLVVLVLSLVVLARRVPRARLLVVALVAFPWLYARAPTGYWQDGRFAVYFPPLIALAVLGAGNEVIGVVARGPWRRTARAVLVTAVVAAAGVSAVQTLDVVTTFAARPFAITGARTEATPASVASGLRRAGITDAYAEYWVAYALDFVSGGSVTASPTDSVRAPDVAADVAGAGNPAWLFPGPTASDVRRTTAGFPNAADPDGLSAARFAAVLARGGVATRTVAVGPMRGVVPSVRITPGDLHRLETTGHR